MKDGTLIKRKENGERGIASEMKKKGGVLI